VDRAYAAAAEAFEGWRDATPSTRQKALLAIADVIEQHADELVEIESQNTGKPVALTRSEEIPPMVDQIRFFAGAARVLEGRSAGEYMAGHTSFVRREPVGVVGQVTPWNYPMMMAVWKFAPAIAAGNTVVLKPSDTTPASAVRMAELIHDADLQAVAENVAIAGYFNAGQDCTAATRVLAGPGIYSDVVSALTEQANGVVSTYDKGPGDEDALLPPVNNANQLARVSSFIE